MIKFKKTLFSIILLFCSPFMTKSALADTPGCVDTQILGPKLITDVCWDCIFPIRVAGFDISGSANSAPSNASKGWVCSCEGDGKIPRIGVPLSMWEPARLVEFQRVPGCMGALNGMTMDGAFDRVFQGVHSTGETDTGDSSFTHYHWYAFPLMIMLDMFVNRDCSSDGYSDFDVMYFSELDPTWHNEELAFFTHMESAAVTSVAASAACVADAAASTAGKPIQALFWCAGAWGNLYPIAGVDAAHNGVLDFTSLYKSRVLAALHRRGLAWRTMGSDAMCRGKIDVILPKTQYKFTLFHPIPETKSSHVMGESTIRWGINRTIPSVGEDPTYMVWRWNECCNT